MARKLEHTVDFSYPVDQVFSVIAGEESLRERLAAVGGTEATLVSHEKSDGGIRYTLRQGIAAEKLPGLIRKVHSGDLIVQREQAWKQRDDGTVRGTGKAAVSGVPGAISVDTVLSPAGHGTRLAVDGQVKVSIPLIGGKLEQLIAEQVVKLLRYEDDFIAEQLAAGG